MSRRATLEGRTILVLEDEPLIALDVEMALEDAGARVLGPVRTAKEATRAIDGALEAGGLDGAVLDVHLGTHSCEAVAERLAALGVPFIFYTGNLPGADGFTGRLTAPVLRKPATGPVLV